MSRIIHTNETYCNTIKVKIEEDKQIDNENFWMNIERSSTAADSINIFFSFLSSIETLPNQPSILFMAGVGLVVRDINDIDVDKNHTYDLYWFKSDSKIVYASNTKGGDNAKVGVLKLNA